MTEAAASHDLLSFWFHKLKRDTGGSLKFSYRHGKRNAEAIADGFRIGTGQIQGGTDTHLAEVLGVASADAPDF